MSSFLSQSLTRCSAAFCVILFLIGLVDTETCAADETDPPTITVSGKAEVKVVPDQAKLTFSIESRNKSLDEGVSENDAKVMAVVAYLKNAGVEDRHISTQLVTIRPIYPDRNKPSFGKQQMAVQTSNNAPNLIPTPPAAKDGFDQLKPIGYTVRRGLSVTITKLDKFEETYRGLVKSGVNEMSGVQFLTSKLRTHKDDTRLQAVRAAREKAKALANELGAKLASVQSIREEGGYSAPRFSNSISFAPSNGGNTVSAGVIEVTSTIHVVFRLKETEID